MTEKKHLKIKCMRFYKFYITSQTTKCSADYNLQDE